MTGIRKRSNKPQLGQMQMKHYPKKAAPETMPGRAKVIRGGETRVATKARITPLNKRHTPRENTRDRLSLKRKGLLKGRSHLT